MKFDIGFAVVGFAMVIFYLRLAQLRGRNRRNARKAELERMQAPPEPKRKKGKQAPPPVVVRDQPSYQVSSWWLVGLGGGLMLLGLALRTSHWFPAQYQPYWWAVATAGVVVFIFCFK